MKKLHVCIYCVLALSFLVGCQQTQQGQGNRENVDSLNIAQQAKDPREKKQLNGQEVAEHLVHLAERVPEVERATAIVLGDLAVVGIDVKEELSRSDVGVIKYEVAESLKKDPHGAYAFISADPDINARLTEMRKDIEDGHPISGILNELAGIVGRLIPVVPGAEHKKSDPEPTNSNDDRLNKGQSQELKNIQEEQGKRKMEDENLEQPGAINRNRSKNEQKQNNE